MINAFDLGKFRPWIILVESTRPRSREESHGAWEPHILAANYQFAYFDGVNRFYVATEHAELAKHFTIPPNVFDDFLVDRMMQAGVAIENGRRAEAEKGLSGWLRKVFGTAR